MATFSSCSRISLQVIFLIVGGAWAGECPPPLPPSGPEGMGLQRELVGIPETGSDSRSKRARALTRWIEIQNDAQLSRAHERVTEDHEWLLVWKRQYCPLARLLRGSGTPRERALDKQALRGWFSNPETLSSDFRKDFLFLLDEVDVNARLASFDQEAAVWRPRLEKNLGEDGSIQDEEVRKILKANPILWADRWEWLVSRGFNLEETRSETTPSESFGPPGEFFDSQIFLPEALTFRAAGDSVKLRAIEVLQEGELEVFLSPGAWRGYAAALAPELLDQYPRPALSPGSSSNHPSREEIDSRLVRESLETAPISEVSASLRLLAGELARFELEIPGVEAAGESFLLMVEDAACLRDLARLNQLSRSAPPASPEELVSYSDLEPGERELMVLGNSYEENLPEQDLPFDPRIFGDASEPIPDGFCPAQLGDEPTPEYHFQAAHRSSGSSWSCPLHGSEPSFRWRLDPEARERFLLQSKTNTLMRSMLRDRGE